MGNISMHEPQAIALPEERIEKSGRVGNVVSAGSSAGEATSLITAISRAAADPNVDIDKMQRLLDMQERVLAKRAEQDFVTGLAAFKSVPLEIEKNRRVSYTTSKGTTEYDHATLDEITRTINKSLSENGLSYRWKTEQLDDGRIRVTCVLTHIGGHSESTSLMSRADDSGGKNSIQAIGSAVSYLQRYTLLAALGLATGTDDDGAATKEEPKLLSATQVADLKALISEVGADHDNFLRYCKVASLDQIYACNYTTCVAALEARRQGTTERRTGAAAQKRSALV